MQDTQTADVRYSFTAQFLVASAQFARKARAIEHGHIDETLRFEHRGYVTAAIMQSVAALEAESAEIMDHGPQHHLGGGTSPEAILLEPLAEIIDRQEVMRRFHLILHLLGKQSFADVQPWQDAAVLVKVRNQITHYKSQWGNDMESQNLFQKVLPQLMQQRHLTAPPFTDGTQNLFPHRFLSAATAAWAVSTAASFISEFYKRLGIDSPIKDYASQIVV
jgi:hypothetical protein